MASATLSWTEKISGGNTVLIVMPISNLVRAISS